MKNIAHRFILVFLISSYAANAQLNYPVTKKVPKVNIYHDIEVKDDYQWLEKNHTPDVLNWVEEQNKVSRNYLKKISKSKSKSIIAKLQRYYMKYGSNKSVKKNKDIYYTLMFPSRNSEANIYYAKGNKSSFEKLLGPKSISKKDRIIFTNLKPSPDDRFLAYLYNRNGSDWKELKIVGIKKRYFFNETLKGILSSQINWYGQGFFYLKNKYHPEKVRRIFPELMYHQLGTEQSQDKVILNVDNENESLSIYGVDKERLYIVKKSDESKNNFSYSYLRPKSLAKEFKPLLLDIKYDMDFVKFKSDTVFVITTIKNKKYIVKFPINESKKWEIISPSYEKGVLTDYEFTKNKIITSFQTPTSSLITVTDYKGNVLGEIVTPEGLSVSKLFYNKNTEKTTFKLSSYTVPPVNCELNLDNYTFKYLGKTEVHFDATKYKFMRKKITSHDGKQVPIFIVYKDSIAKDGNTPFLLETYGGYGTVAKPSFDPNIIYFIEKGGAYAYVHVRGGGEFGYDWWQDGRKLNKKNGILDFTAAAEYLIKEGYTKPKKIGITGTSHGGLITAAAMMEKPDIFGAAVINVGALDMLRIEKTETGSAYVNVNEFGTVKKKNEFMNLLSYSPFHNINKTINYPSTLIVTGSNDTRVPPFQSYKFAGKLQNGLNQKNPILLWTQEKVGHFGASQYKTTIEESSFMYNFLIHELTKND